MASIVKRGKSYSVVYYQGTGKKRQQVWESGLSYSTAKSRKTQIEHEQATNTITTVDSKDMTVSEFLYEFIEKYGLKNGGHLPMTETTDCWKIMCTPTWVTKSSVPSRQKR